MIYRGLRLIVLPGGVRVWLDLKTGRRYPAIYGAHDVFDVAADAFRFYQDGTESGSTPLAAENTNITVNVDGGDQQVQLRYRVQEVGAGSASGAATDDYGLDFDKNALSSFTPITASSSNVKADTGSTLTDGSATTNRATDGITDGTGSFIAGEQEAANGVIEDFQHTANNFTEHVWGLLVVAADVANNDTLDFRMTLNGGTPGMTNSVTPRITIQKSGPPDELIQSRRMGIQISEVP